MNISRRSLMGMGACPAFVGSVSTQTPAAGTPFTMICDYGVASNAVYPFGGGEAIAAVSYVGNQGTAAKFSVTYPAGTTGSHPIGCQLADPSNPCHAQNIVATVNVGGTGGGGGNPTLPRVVTKGESNQAIYMVGSTGLYLFPDYTTFTGAGYHLSDVQTATTAERALPILGTVGPNGQPVLYPPNTGVPSPPPVTPPVTPPVPTGGNGDPTTVPGGGSLPGTIFGVNSTVVLFGGAALVLLMLAGHR